MPRIRRARLTIALLATVLAGLAGATQASAVDVGTFNLKTGKAEVHPFASVIGWQEAEVAQTPGVMNKLRALGGYKTYFPQGNRRARFSANAVPISWEKSKFDVVKKDYKLTHAGEEDVSPNRYVVWVVLRNRQTQKTFVFINTHFISKAFTGKPERRERWNTHLDILQKRAARLGKKYAAPVVVVGDFNRPAYSDIPGLSPVGGAGDPPPYDQIYATTGVPADPVQRLGPWGSDHSAFASQIKLP